jgi:hypothetical protein
LTRVAGATVCALLLSSAAGAFELPPVGGIDVVGRDEKLVQFEFGAFLGVDTNVFRAPDATKESDSFLRLLGGASFTKGNDRRKLDVRFQAHADKYFDLSQYDLQETIALLGVQVDTNSVLASLRAEYAMLADPTDIELTDLAERTRMTILPNVDIRFGETLELALGYAIKSTDYDGALNHLDYDEGSLMAEFRWGRREGGRQLFVHFDTGEFEYGPGIRDGDDFEFDRFYAGLRTETSRSTHELAVGTSSVDVMTLPGSELYATYRSTFRLNESRSLLLGVAHGPEAAAGAEHKVATRILASYRQQINTRWRWSLNVGHESAELMTPDPGFPTDLSRLTIDAGASMDVGSPDGLRGRAYGTFGYENRGGPDASFDYGRLRVLLGLSLVY